MSAPEKVGFAICEHKGFHITFENGWTASVQFGYGNYAENYDWRGSNPDDPMSRFNDAPPKSGTAEIAAWSAKDAWHKFEDDDQVQGHQNPAQVLAFLILIAGKAPA